jgi:mRNA interferase MazF
MFMAKPTLTTDSYPQRGEIYLVNFDPTIGAEIKKTRPAVVIQNDIGNQYGSTTIVAAITGNGQKANKAPVSVLAPIGTGSLTKDSLVLLNQIRTVDKQRLVSFIGTLPNSIMKKVDEQLKVSLGM